MRRPTRRRWSGFTLLELLVVVLIIGIILTFILVAAQDAVRAAEYRQTQALITKLEAALNDRLEALLATSVDINPAHQFVASVQNPLFGQGNQPPFLPGGGARAMVIARFDYIKAELPDVFLVQSDPLYPINFAGLPYPGTPITQAAPGIVAPPPGYAPFILPLGNAIQNAQQSGGSSFGAGNIAVPSGSGIFGASYAAASGIYAQLGYLPTGYDGADNNGNGLIDELAEGILSASQQQQQQILANIQALAAHHTHKTARAEMLYALLVSGRSPLGTPFRPEDFNNPREVRDTDGDGLLEFVDAWGEPLQFYRWPIHFHSDIQKGSAPYQGFEARQQNSLDTNQQLIAPAWFWNLSAGRVSNNAAMFQQFFTSLVDPNWPNTAFGQAWDRGNYYPRRAFFSRFLIASSGPDKLLGIARSDPYWVAGRETDTNYSLYNASTQDDGTGPGPPDMSQTGLTPIHQIILIENEATGYDPNRPAGPFGLFQAEPQGTAATAFLQASAQDDITNQQVKGPGGLP
ncbi:MAG TPA: prepilin-type N-terminal cleavage/methylation domain-containing protein [Isosphaeraceae bacterium]|jgi:prepilin-type N-terminal cleavage/methylation domain-containing protein|nr:prepilin-type N-terminal cleavage/methylation domain-containing protein [Isosphaeraceae bacterium]